MRKYITIDDVWNLESERIGTGDRADQRLRDRIATFIDWATDPERFELDDSVTRAHLLTVAAEHLLNLGDLDESLEVALRAFAQPDATKFEVHPVLIDVRLARGERAEAEALADEVRRSRTDDFLLCERIAETYEHRDEPAIAERWFTIALRAAEREDSTLARLQRRSLLIGRWRVRRAQGKPEDMLDVEVGEEIALAEFGR